MIFSSSNILSFPRLLLRLRAFNCTQSHLIALHFVAFHRYCLFFFFLFNKLKICDNPVLSKSIGSIFPIAFSHFVSVLHLVVFQYFRVFHYYCICYGDLPLDLWYNCCNCSGVLQTTPIYDRKQSINVASILTAPPTGHLLCFYPSPLASRPPWETRKN